MDCLPAEWFYFFHFFFFFSNLEMNFRPIENLTQCPMEKLKDIYYALILIDTCSILQDVVCHICHKVILRWCHIGGIFQGIPDIVSSCNSVSWICVLWRKLGGRRLVFSWEELLVTWQPGNILLFLENPFSSLYHLVLRLCLRRKGYVCSADEALSIGRSTLISQHSWKLLVYLLTWCESHRYRLTKRYMEEVLGLITIGNLLICGVETNRTSLAPCQCYKNKHIRCFGEFRKRSICIQGQTERKLIYIHPK